MGDTRMDSAWRVSIPRTSTRREAGSGKEYTSYEVVIHIGRTQWAVHRRYSDFLALKKHIQARYNISRLPSFPRKQPLGKNSASIVQLRRAALEAFLAAATAVPGVPTDEDFLEFLEAPETVRSSCPPAMQGYMGVMVVGADNQFQRRWLELRGSVLTYSLEEGVGREGSVDLVDSLTDARVVLACELGPGVPVPVPESAMAGHDARRSDLGSPLSCICLVYTSYATLALRASSERSVRGWAAVMLFQQGRRQAAQTMLHPEADSLATPPDPTSQPLPMVARSQSFRDAERFERWLRRVGLLRYLTAFEEAGYDELDLLAALDTPESVAAMVAAVLGGEPRAPASIPDAAVIAAESRQAGRDPTDAELQQREASAAAAAADVEDEEQELCKARQRLAVAVRELQLERAVSAGPSPASQPTAAGSAGDAPLPGRSPPPPPSASSTTSSSSSSSSAVSAKVAPASVPVSAAASAIDGSRQSLPERRHTISERGISANPSSTGATSGQSMRWTTMQLIERQENSSQSTRAELLAQHSVAQAFRGTLPSVCFDIESLRRGRNRKVRLLRLGPERLEILKPPDKVLHSVDYEDVSEAYLANGSGNDTFVLELVLQQGLAPGWAKASAIVARRFACAGGATLLLNELNQRMDLAQHLLQLRAKAQRAAAAAAAAAAMGLERPGDQVWGAAGGFGVVTLGSSTRRRRASSEAAAAVASTSVDDRSTRARASRVLRSRSVAEEARARASVAALAEDWGKDTGWDLTALLSANASDDEDDGDDVDDSSDDEITGACDDRNANQDTVGGAAVESAVVGNAVVEGAVVGGRIGLPLSAAQREAQLDSKRARSKLATEMMKMTGMTEPQRLAYAVDKLLHGEEAADRAEILEPLRVFISKTFAELEPEPERAVLEVRQMLEKARAVILQKRISVLRPLLVEIPLEEGHISADVEETDEASGPGARSTRFVSVQTLSHIVYARLEQAVVRPLRPRLLHCIRQLQPDSEPMGHSDEHLNQVAQASSLFGRQQAQLRRFTQAYFGIRSGLISISGWGAAVAELGTICTRDLPSEQLGSLVSAAKTIYTLFEAEQQQERASVNSRRYQSVNVVAVGNEGDPAEDAAPQTKSKGGGVTISGDDFLPIFIWVTVHADLDDAPRLWRYIFELADPKLLVGEGGYYLGVLEAAIQFVESWEEATYPPDLVQADIEHQRIARQLARRNRRNGSIGDGEVQMATPTASPSSLCEGVPPNYHSRWVPSSNSKLGPRPHR